MFNLLNWSYIWLIYSLQFWAFLKDPENIEKCEIFLKINSFLVTMLHCNAFPGTYITVATMPWHICINFLKYVNSSCVECMRWCCNPTSTESWCSYLRVWVMNIKAVTLGRYFITRRNRKKVSLESTFPKNICMSEALLITLLGFPTLFLDTVRWGTWKGTKPVNTEKRNV